MTLPARPVSADMVVDTSAIIAILLGEDHAARVEAALRAATGPIMAGPTRTELLIVAAARSADADAGAAAARAVLDAADVVTVPVDEMLAEMAFDAWARFGKGRHRAKLNYGDVFAYAVARHWSLPLLCVGADFAETDLDIVDVG